MGNLWKSVFRLSLGGAVAIVPQLPGVAQRGLSLCQPPQGAEFLVLVFTPSQPLQNEVRLQAEQTLTEAQTPIVCEYNGSVLSRIGGFSSLEKATQWSEYFGEAVGLPLMVITPVESDQPLAVAQNQPQAIAPSVSDLFVTTTTPTSGTQPPALPLAQAKTAPQVATSTPASFQPQALRGGFGVLVDYGGSLAIATRLKSLVEGDIGLVAYNERGYLLAAHTEDANQITALLNRLNQNGLGAIAVPADQLILLKSSINL
ncbi:MAG: hypothetical protein VKJ86_07350 [Synechococcus sp.]|nr:hypothetical protein [Synechococcus sp.]